ncbi:YtxH domain-containing protein [Candidatus Gracilibacteria bacterium]|jgi:gas vesicle protein|nr:YtxH domain-containing protein [Candidatus Gracilibacteria bacterium]
MSEEEKKEGSKILDKVLMGAIIGGAIGSVLGASIAPKKGSETRKDLGKIASIAKEKSFTFFHKITHLFRKK